MKVFIIISSPTLGGAQRVAINLTYWLTSNTDCEATILSLKHTTQNSYSIDGLKYEELKGGNKVRELRSIIKRENPDLVLTMGVPLCIYTVSALIGLKVVHIVSERNDPVHFAGKTTTKILSRILMKLADGYVFQTKDAQNYYGGRIAANSVVIHNPLFKKSQLFKEQQSCTEKVIVSVGRLNKQKNQSMLIRAFGEINELYPEYTLIIYGEGPERNALKSLINKLNLNSRVYLPGSTNNVLDKIKKASLFVLTSDFEGMPNALMEAMALGLPCISTDCPCGGPRELIKDGINGILIPVGDKNALVEAIKRLIENREMALQMGRNALEIRKTHAMDTICQRWLDYFRKIVKENKTFLCR